MPQTARAKSVSVSTQALTDQLFYALVGPDRSVTLDRTIILRHWRLCQFPTPPPPHGCPARMRAAASEAEKTNGAGPGQITIRPAALAPRLVIARARRCRNDPR